MAVLSCHDRVIFKGYLPFGGDNQLMSTATGIWAGAVNARRRTGRLPHHFARQASRQVYQTSGLPSHAWWRITSSAASDRVTGL